MDEEIMVHFLRIMAIAVVSFPCLLFGMVISMKVLLPETTRRASLNKNVEEVEAELRIARLRLEKATCLAKSERLEVKREQFLDEVINNS